jgi:hypothetical protein
VKRLTDAGGSTGLNQISQIVPDKFEVYQNYPNPFNPSTTIRFNIPSGGFTNLSVYNMLGQKVETLLNKRLDAGSYRYDWHPSGLSSGVYYYILKSDNYSDTKKMLLIK